MLVCCLLALKVLQSKQDQSHSRSYSHYYVLPTITWHLQPASAAARSADNKASSLLGPAVSMSVKSYPLVSWYQDKLVVLLDCLCYQARSGSSCSCQSEPGQTSASLHPCSTTSCLNFTLSWTNGQFFILAMHQRWGPHSQVCRGGKLACHPIWLV